MRQDILARVWMSPQQEEHDDEEQDRKERDQRRPPRRRTCGLGRTADRGDQGIDTRLDGAVAIAGANSRHHVVLDDPAGARVGNVALQPVADFDAQLAIVAEDEQRDAVVVFLAPDAPGLERLRRPVLQRLAAEGPVDPDEQLVAGAALVVLELARQLGGEARRQEPRAVGHELGRRGRNRRAVRAGAPRGGHARDDDGRERDDPHPPASGCHGRPGVRHLELDAGRGLGARLRLEVGLLREPAAERAGDDVPRERVARAVERLRGLHETHPLDGDAVLRPFELNLQIAEGLRRLQVGITLDDDQQLRQRRRQLILRVAEAC